MGVSERYSLYYKVICRVCGVSESSDRAQAHHIFAECDRREHSAKERDAGLRSVDRVKGGLFILLHILIVSKRKAFHSGQKRHQIAVYSSGLSPDKFADIRILLLRHDAAAR